MGEGGVSTIEIVLPRSHIERASKRDASTDTVEQSRTGPATRVGERRIRARYSEGVVRKKGGEGVHLGVRRHRDERLGVFGSCLLEGRFIERVTFDGIEAGC